MKKQIITLLTVAAVATACKKDNNENTTPIDDHGQELITTVILEVMEGNNKQSYTFRDIDGPGGNDATLPDTIVLNANGNYTTNLILLDESQNVADTISNELELDEHFVCYEGADNYMNITHTDTDGTYTVGLTTSLNTLSSTGNGGLTVSLKHQPNIKDGTCAPGETDVEVIFGFKVL